MPSPTNTKPDGKGNGKGLYKDTHVGGSYASDAYPWAKYKTADSTGVLYVPNTSGTITSTYPGNYILESVMMDPTYSYQGDSSAALVNATNLDGVDTPVQTNPIYEPGKVTIPGARITDTSLNKSFALQGGGCIHSSHPQINPNTYNDYGCDSKELITFDLLKINPDAWVGIKDTLENLTFNKMYYVIKFRPITKFQTYSSEKGAYGNSGCTDIERDLDIIFDASEATMIDGVYYKGTFYLNLKKEVPFSDFGFSQSQESIPEAHIRLPKLVDTNNRGGNFNYTPSVSTSQLKPGYQATLTRGTTSTGDGYNFAGDITPTMYGFSMEDTSDPYYILGWLKYTMDPDGMANRIDPDFGRTPPIDVEPGVGPNQTNGHIDNIYQTSGEITPYIKLPATNTQPLETHRKSIYPQQLTGDLNGLTQAIQVEGKGFSGIGYIWPYFDIYGDRVLQNQIHQYLRGYNTTNQSQNNIVATGSVIESSYDGLGSANYTYYFYLWHTKSQIHDDDPYIYFVGECSPLTSE